MKKNVAIVVLAGLAFLFLCLWHAAEMDIKSHKKKVTELAGTVKSYEEGGGRERNDLEKFKMSLTSMSLKELLNTSSPMNLREDVAQEVVDKEVERRILNRYAYLVGEHGQTIRIGDRSYSEGSTRQVIRSLMAMQADKAVNSEADVVARKRSWSLLSNFLIEYTKVIEIFQTELAEVISKNKEPDRALGLFLNVSWLAPTEQSLKDALYNLIGDDPEKMWGWNFYEGLTLLRNVIPQDGRVYDLIIGREWQKAKKKDEMREVILQFMDERSRDVLVDALHNDPYEFARDSALFSLEIIGKRQGYPAWLLDELLIVAKNDPSYIVQGYLTKVVAEGYGHNPAAEKFLRRRTKSEFAVHIKYFAPHLMK